MPKYTPPRRKGHGAVIPPLSVSDRVDSLLKEMLSIFPNKTELTEAEIEHWHRYLEPYHISAIEWAFENWRRSGSFFPVYSDILDLIGAWEPPAERKTPKYCGECESGWIRVFEGTTAGGSPVDPKFGAMKRCQCLLQRMAA